MVKHIAAVMLGLLPLVAVAQADPPVAKVSVSAAGRLSLNGKSADLKSVEAEFKRLQAVKGAVWYHRENGQTQEPHPQALAVIQLIVKYRLPVSMSSKPDFSDYVDGEGYSRPRGVPADK